MNEPTAFKTSTAGDAQAIIDACAQIEPVHQVEPGRIYAVRQPGGGFTTLDLSGDQYREFPQHKRGHVHVRDVASLAAYHGKHADDWSEVYADLDGATITTVLDAHMGESDGARWQAHRATLTMQQTPQWRTWTACDRQPMSQQVFAEFIEDNATDIAPGGPVAAADLLELAQQFHAHTKVEFKSGKRLKDGQTQFVYTETIDAKAGERGTIEIPDAFDLVLAPFEDCEPYRVGARFRYRLNGGDLRLFYQLFDPDKVFRDAVLQVVALAEAECDLKIMRGRPA